MRYIVTFYNSNYVSIFLVVKCNSETKKIYVCTLFIINTSYFTKTKFEDKLRIHIEKKPVCWYHQYDS